MPYENEMFDAYGAPLIPNDEQLAEMDASKRARAETLRQSQLDLIEAEAGLTRALETLKAADQKVDQAVADRNRFAPRKTFMQAHQEAMAAERRSFGVDN